MVAEPVPPELPPDLAQLIQGPWGSAPTNVAIPAEGPPRPLTISGAGQAWSDDVKWITDRYDQIVDQFGGSFDISPEATRLKAHALAQAQTEAMSGHVNIQADYTATVAQQIAGYLHLQTMYFQRINAVLQAKVDGLTAILEQVTPMVDAKVLEGVARSYAYTDGAVQFAQAAQQGWSIDHIFAPLLENIGSTAAQLSHVIDTKVVEGVGVAIDAAQAALLPVAELAITTSAAIGPIKDVLRALQQESTDCTQPMCDAMGPKTDLGKWLKALNLAATAALLAELAALDGAGIERLLAGLVALSNGVVNDIDALFTGGETVGQLLTGIGG